MELINRENILRYIADLQLTTTPMTDAYESLQAVWNCVAAAVDYSGEYVSVVRCKDCEHYTDEYYYLRWCYPRAGDAYCSEGKRREE